MAKHLNLDDRQSIQLGLKNGMNYTEIAKQLGKNKSTIYREIQKYRIFIHYTNVVTIQPKNVCVKRFNCSIKINCKSPVCYNIHNKSCKLCGACNSYCTEFEEEVCEKYNYAPYVCNGCPKKPRCPLSKWIYDAKKAQSMYEEKLSDSRQGISLNESELVSLDKIVSPLLKKGQSVRHICQIRGSEITVSNRTIYKYLHNNYLSADLFDLKRTVQRKHRKKPGPPLLIDKSCRLNRLYSDFLLYVKQHPESNIVEADTIEGCKGGKVILTLFFRNCNLQLGFLREQNTSASVSSVFDYLRKILTHEEMAMLFPIILTDRGTEFSDPLRMESNLETGEIHSRVFYCDPQNANQKSGCERNHEFFRYYYPKGTSLDSLNQDMVDLIFCHINSYGRSKFNYKSPSDLFRLIYGDTVAKKLGVITLDPLSVTLTPDIFN